MSGHPKNGPPPTTGPIPPAGAPLRYCEYCLSWNSKPCGEQCHLPPAAPSPKPPAPAKGAPDVAGLVTQLRKDWVCLPDGLLAKAADALTAQAAEIERLRVKEAGIEAAIAAIEPDARDLIADINARIESGAATEIEADCRDALRTQAAALAAKEAEIWSLREAVAHAIQDPAEVLGCAPDNESIMEAIDKLKNERDQFMEQAAMRDNRDADMQAIMGANNGLKARIAELEAALRLAQEWIARVTADTDEVADYLNGDRRDGVGGRCGWDDGVDVLKKVDAALARKEAQP